MASLSREGKETKERDVSTVDYPSIETASLAKSIIYFILREKCSKKTPQKTKNKTPKGSYRANYNLSTICKIQTQNIFRESAEII